LSCFKGVFVNHLRILILAGLAFTLGACDGTHRKPNIESVTDMMDQPAIKGQGVHPNDPSRSGMRVPPAGTAPRNFVPYKYAGNAELAGRELRNPLAGDMSPEVISLGRIYYQRYCSVCHADSGNAQTPVAQAFGGVVRSLLTAQARQMSDGRLYHIITDGQGVMNSYASQMPDSRHRWAVVNYIRNLQAQNPNQ
jgi:mono/diheme cytochrome c family protein